MVCCTLFVLLIATVLYPLKKISAISAKPLAWRLFAEEETPPFTLSARIQSFTYAINGLQTVAQQEHNFRIHIVAVVSTVLLGYWFDISSQDWLYLILAIALVLFAETINTAFEHLCDVVSPTHNQSVAHAKDIAAGAVLLCAIAAILIGFIVFTPYVYTDAHSAWVLMQSICASK